MSIVIDTNMRLFAERMNITSSRMVRDYGLKTIDEIIEAEAAQGNTKAVNYAREMYGSSDQLIKIFRLTDVENKYVILHNMDSRTRAMILPMLEEEDLVMGLYFFTKDKLLEILMHVDIEELVKVVRSAFPLPEIVKMFTEEDMAEFFKSDKLERYDVIEQLKSLPPDVMKKFIESVTGQPSEETNPLDLIKNIENLPDDKYKQFMSSIDPDVQRQLIFQLTKERPEYLELFKNDTYVEMLSKLMKQEMVPHLINLEKETLIKVVSGLPADLLSIVSAQVDTKKFADFLLEGHTDLLKSSLMI